MRVRLALLLFFTFSLFAQTEKLRDFETFAQEEMKAQHIPALSVAVKYGDFEWSRGFGESDLENHVAATQESSYRMASVTKPMTAVAILKLADEGKIDLDAEVQKYVPYFPRKPYTITVRQLLSHQGGISHYRDYMTEGRIKEPKTTKEAIAIFQDFDLIAEPGTQYNYSSYGFNLLGAVIEGASGLSYGDYLTANVWKPLGMTSTRMDDPRALIPHRVVGYTFENGQLRRSEYVDISSRFGGGGTRSTVIDMVRFLEGLANGKVLKAETREKAWTQAATRDGRLTHYGYGFGLYSRNGRYVIAHSGSQQETRTTMSYIPDAKLYIALASNLEEANLSRFEDKLIELLLGDPALPTMRVATLEDDRTLAALTSIYSTGLAYYSRTGHAMTTDKRELDAAMKYFNTSLTDLQKIDEGEHLMSGQPFAKIGSYIAATLAQRGSLDVYHREGPLRFISDFTAINRDMFDKAFARRVQIWLNAWKALPPDALTINVAARDGLERIERLATVPIKPDYVSDLVELGETAALANDLGTAMRIAEVGVKVYPTSPSLHGFRGLLQLIKGDHDAGIASLRKSLTLDPSGYASARNLANIARNTPDPISSIVKRASQELHGN